MKTLLIFLFSVTALSCHAQQQRASATKVVYQSDKLIITQLSENAFAHTSYLQTQDFGNVPCNGLIVKNSKEAIVFDTPSNDKDSEELIKWIKEKLHCKINAIVPTHFHNDCLGGLQAFHKTGVPSYAYSQTIALAKANNFVVPENSFSDSLVLTAGKEKVVVKFFGEGHTKDNVVGYFPSENILFGGCLVKELDAGKGYLGDANVAVWPGTVEKVKQAYPQVKIVVPGHGECGGRELLDYTVKLFGGK